MPAKTGEISLPPPIRDPISGKVFVAIPAPPFILAQDGTALGDSHALPCYVYVERKDVKATRMFSKEREATPVHRRSIGHWTSVAANSPPPPQHIPWKGVVSPASSSESIPLEPNTSQISPSKKSTADRSSSSIDLPSFESGVSLIRGRLPSTHSTVTDSESSANISIPSFTEVAARRPHSCESSRRSRSSDTYANERRNTCETVMNHREAHVFRRRPELGSAETPRQSTILTPQLNQLKLCEWRLGTSAGHANFDMDSCDENTPVQAPRSRLGNPSLVVSTSHHATLISLDSTRQMQLPPAQPLDIVKKHKRTPAPLNLIIPSRQSAHYPDVPTPFCSSPWESDGKDKFADSVYPRLHVDTKLSTEEMIESLLSQVKQFKPKVPEKSIMSLGHSKVEHDDAPANVNMPTRATVGLGFSVGAQVQQEDTSILSTLAEKSHFMDRPSVIESTKSPAIPVSTPASPVKSSISGGRSRSGTTSSSACSEKRVRFGSAMQRRISTVLSERDDRTSAIPRSPPRSSQHTSVKPMPATISTMTSPKRQVQTQIQTSPRNNASPPGQRFRTFQYQKRTSMHRMSLAGAGLMNVNVNAKSGTDADSDVSTPVGIPTLTRATPTFTPSRLLPRRRMTDTLPRPTFAANSVTPRTFVAGTPTPAQTSTLSRRMTLASTPRMRNLTVGVARGKENKDKDKSADKENKEKAREVEKENKEIGKRVKASEALLAKKRYGDDENEVRRGNSDGGKGIMKALPFQGVLNRLKT